MKVVSVNWHDAWSHDEQCDLDLAITLCAKPLNVVTTGYLVTENDDCIVIARDWIIGDNHVSGVMHIPKGWIDGDIIVLKE